MTGAGPSRPTRRAAPPQRRTRVLQVIDHLYVGGAQSILLALAQLIDRERFEVHLAVLGGSDETLADAARARSEGLHVLPYRPLWDPRTAAGLRRMVHEHDIDVLHTHLASAEWHGALAARMTGRPMVTTLHSIAADRRSPSRLRNLAGVVAVRLAGRVFAVSEAVRDSHVNELGLSPRRVEVLHNVPVAPLFLGEGFSSDRKREELRVEGDLICTASRLTAMRDHQTLIRSVPRLLREFPALDVLILGEGEQEEPLRALVVELELEERVRMLGTRFDAVEIMAASDIVCQPTLYEGLPVTVLDAMSLGVAVVASNVTGVQELIDDGRTGILVPPADPDALANALGRLLADPGERSRIGAASREHVLAAFDPQAWIARIEATYLELAAGGRRRSRARA